MSDNNSRAERVAFAKASLDKAISNVSGASDECLGVEELTFTEAELQKAVLRHGKPFEKSLHFRGDDSHYRAIFHLKLVSRI